MCVYLAYSMEKGKIFLIDQILMLDMSKDPWVSPLFYHSVNKTYTR